MAVATADTMEITMDDSAPSPVRRSNSFRAGAAAGGDTAALLARKDSEIRRLLDEKTGLEERASAAERAAAEAKADDVATARKIARAIETAERTFANERRLLQKLAGRSDFISVELDEANARHTIEMGGLIELHRLVDEAASRALLLEELQQAVKPLRSKVTALNFQLRVSKAIELKNNQRKLAEVKSKLFDLETASAAQSELQKRCDDLTAELAQARFQLSSLQQAGDGETPPTKYSVASETDTQRQLEVFPAERQAEREALEIDYQRRLDAERHTSETTIARLQEDLMRSTEKVENLTARVHTADGLIESLSDEVATLNANIAELRVARGDSSSAIDSQTIRALSSAVSRLLAPLNRTRLEDAEPLGEHDPSADEGFEFAKHVLTARLSDIVRCLSNITESSEVGDAETFVNQVFEVANIPSILQRLHKAEREVELKNIALSEVAQSQTATTSDQIRQLESQLQTLGGAYERLEGEAKERLQLAETLMARIDEMRAEHTDRVAVFEADNAEARAAAIQHEEDLRRSEMLLSLLARRLSDTESELTKAQMLRSSSEATIARLTAEKQRQAAEASDKLEAESSKWRVRIEELNVKLDDRLNEASHSAKLVQQLKTEVAKLQTELDEVREQYTHDTARLQNSIQELTTASAEIEARRNRLQTVSASTETQLREAESTVKRHELALKSLQFEFDQFKIIAAQREAGLKAELEQALATVQEAQQAVVAKGSDAATLMTSCTELQRQLKEARDEISVLRTQESEARAEFDQQHAQLRDRYQTELAALMANAQRLEIHCNERVLAVETASEDRFNAFRGDYEACKAKVQALEEEMMLLAAQYQAEATTAEQLRSRVNDLETAARRAEEHHAIQMEDQTTKLASARHENAGLQEALINAQHKAREAQMESENTRSNASDQLIAVKRAHHKEIALHEEKLSAALARIKSLEAAVNRKDAELQDQRALLSTAEQRDVESQSAIAMRDKLKLDVEALLRQCGAAQDKADSAIAEKVAAQAALAKSMALVGELTNNLHAAQLQVEELERQRAAMKQLVEDREMQIGDGQAELRKCREAMAAMQDEAMKISTLHAMTKTELAATKTEHQMMLQALRDAEQLNVDLLERVAEVENSLDETRLSLQQEQSARLLESVTRNNADVFVSATMSRVSDSTSPSRQLSVMFDRSLRSRNTATTIELAEFEIRTGLVEQANDYLVMVRRLRGVLDDMSHTDRLVRQRLTAEQRRVQSLSDHAASLQAECVAIREAWRVANSSSLTESILMLMLEEAQGRRVLEFNAIHALTSVTRDNLVFPLQFEAQRLVSARKEAAREQGAANEAVGRAVQAEDKLRASEASVAQLRQLLTDADAALRNLRDSQSSEHVQIVNAAQKGAQLRLSSVEADEAYCRWSIFESAFSGLTLLHNMLSVVVQAPRGRDRRGLNTEHNTRLVREIAMWRSRCHAIVELEKASLDAAMDTAVRGRRDNLAPPRAAALVTIQTLEQMERRLLQQSFFETQLMLAQCAGWC